MDNITKNGFDNPKFSVNASNLMLMPQKKVVGPIIILFFLKSFFT